MQRAISLYQTGTATQSLNSRRMERRAPLPLGLTLPAWPSTTRAISLWRIKSTRSSNSRPMEPGAHLQTTCPQSEAQASKLTAWSLTVRAISLNQTIAARGLLNLVPMEHRARSHLGSEGTWPLTERAISLWRTMSAARSSNSHLTELGAASWWT